MCRNDFKMTKYIKYQAFDQSATVYLCTKLHSHVAELWISELLKKMQNRGFNVMYVLIRDKYTKTIEDTLIFIL